MGLWPEATHLTQGPRARYLVRTAFRANMDYTHTSLGLGCQHEVLGCVLATNTALSENPTRIGHAITLYTIYATEATKLI